MATKKLDTITKYKKENPKKAIQIQKAVKQGIKDYAETFRRLATT